MKKKKKKEFQSALFSPLGLWTGNIFLFKGGLIEINRLVKNSPALHFLSNTIACFNLSQLTDIRSLQDVFLSYHRFYEHFVNF